MTSSTSAAEELGRLLADTSAAGGGQTSVPPALAPVDNAAAYQAQRAFLHGLGAAVGGWKVGSKSADGPIQGAPLPQPWLYGNGAALERARFPVLGIELEIMFRLRHAVTPGGPLPAEEEVLAAIDGVAASVEIVSSRLAGWPDVPKPSQLADLQNHGALVAGAFVPYDTALDYLAPQATLEFNGKAIFDGAGSNPAGDPRRLLYWVVRHCHEQGIALPAGTPITAGSYTGMYFPTEGGTVTGRIAGLPPIRFELA